MITEELFIAYSQCPYKVYSFLCFREKSIPNEYATIRKSVTDCNIRAYVAQVKESGMNVSEYSHEKLLCLEADSLTNAILTFENFSAFCPVLLKSEKNNSYEPVAFTGSYTVSKHEQLQLLYIGYILTQLQKTAPLSGKIIIASNRARTIKFNDCAPKVRRIIEPLAELIQHCMTEPPSLILNKHCGYCEFKAFCKATAKEHDALSLLHGISTKKAISKYEKKGIFTVKQLSYLYKPRRRKKRARTTTLLYKFELQALAIRTNKIYLIDPPKIIRQPVEIFLDIEGMPDQNFYYLIGLGVYAENTYRQYSFWANTLQDEEATFKRFVAKIDEYPKSHIYHYGSYESKVIQRLGERYEVDTEVIQRRMVNVNPFIYGKIYFPTYSNSLKDIAKFLEFTWASPHASGLQSIVWRYYWDETHNPEYKTVLCDYNKDDCYALKEVVDALSNIQGRDDVVSDLEHSVRGKRCPKHPDDTLHQQLQSVLKMSYLGYDKNKISFSDDVGAKKDRPLEKKKPRKRKKRTPTRIVRVRRRVVCPKCGKTPLPESKNTTEKLTIDLKFTKTGVRKTITKYWASKSYCSGCLRAYNPPYFNIHGHPGLYGRGFKAWIVYQRTVLRQPYGRIRQMIEDLFDENITEGRMLQYIQEVADFYTDTEKMHIKRILKNPYVHVDETPINIYGTNQYVWVFTDGKYVVLRLAKTREITTAQDFLTDYKGVLITDFYSGYDSFGCLHQKCWVHLVRELNDNLWESPFDSEFREFVHDVRDLIVPIMIAIKKYGVKTRHLAQFRKTVTKFYDHTIYNRYYKSELCIKFQARFKKYKDHLFLFLEMDDLPWNNNTAERVVIHLKRQNDISRIFREQPTTNYLKLLGIVKTCQLHKKPFLRFLLAGEKDVLNFKKSRKLSKDLRPYNKGFGLR